MNTNEYIVANHKMEELVSILTNERELTTSQQLELDKVSDNIASYEEEHYPFKAETLVEMIELRMFQRKLKQKDLAVILETNPSRISELLNGKRDLTMDIARRLYQKLNIDPEILLSESTKKYYSTLSLPRKVGFMLE